MRHVPRRWQLEKALRVNCPGSHANERTLTHLLPLRILSGSGKCASLRDYSFRVLPDVRLAPELCLGLCDGTNVPEPLLGWA